MFSYLAKAIMKTPKLSLEELRHYYGLELSRFKAKREKNVGSQKVTPYKDDVTLAFEGLAAQKATEKLFSHYNMVANPSEDSIELGGDNGIDFVLVGGSSVDVKYTFGRNRNLLVLDDNPESLSADIAILVWPTEENLAAKKVASGINPDHYSEYDIVGFIRREEFIAHNRINGSRNFGYGFRSWMPHGKLSPISELLG